LETVQVNWVQGVTRWPDISTAKSAFLDKKGLYAVLIGKWDENNKNWTNPKLVYIGQSLDQTIRQRLLQPHPAYECIKEQLTANPSYQALVMGGEIVTQTKLTQQLADDIECCLVYRNKPICNVKCKESYTGRELLVRNTGDFNPLAEESTCM
jgi:hypothetical protein